MTNDMMKFDGEDDFDITRFGDIAKLTPNSLAQGLS